MKGSRLLPESKGLCYSEVHHLRPLGRGYSGVDAWKNMLVLCPTCHAEFDLLAMAIDPKSFRIVTYADRHPCRGKRLTMANGHALDNRSIRYHWRLFKEAARV